MRLLAQKYDVIIQIGGFMMDEFLKDREYEFEMYAIVDYFKLLKQIELAKKEGFPIFKLIGGMETMIRLEESVKNGFFDAKMTNCQLFSSLSNHANRLHHNVTCVKTVFIEEAIENSSTIQSFPPNVDLNHSAYQTLDEFLAFFPTNVTLPFMMKLIQDSNDNAKEKKIEQK